MITRLARGRFAGYTAHPPSHFKLPNLAWFDITLAWVHGQKQDTVGPPRGKIVRIGIGIYVRLWSSHIPTRRWYWIRLFDDTLLNFALSLPCSPQLLEFQRLVFELRVEG